MAYSAQNDVQNAAGGNARLVQLADWDDDGAPDPAVLADAIAAADALIDSYASKRFAVPFNPVPQIIVETSAELACIVLARRRRMSSHVEEARWEQLAGPQGWLHDLATGVVTPAGDPLPLKHSTMAVEGVSEGDCGSGDREISRERLAGFW